MKFKPSKLRCLLIIIAVIPLLLLTACKRDTRITDIALPPTSILQIQTSWAVITSSHLRLRQEPKTNAPVVTTLWKGNVLELLMKSPAEDTVEGEIDYWYKVSYSGLSGWVFGHYLDFFSSREEALRAAAGGSAGGVSDGVDTSPAANDLP